ncbi:hypothetical protein B0H13DRAFT_1892824 [Mycena leptocephala]|nr:hypothetical protein B0H13DRAFT_1892824 [Mycena leptocephala]
MAPLLYVRAGPLAAGSKQEIDASDDSLFDDLFVEDSFEPSKLGDWLNRRGEADSRSDSEDSDVESVNSGEDSDGSIDSDDEFDDIKVLAGAGDADSASSGTTVGCSNEAAATSSTSPPAATSTVAPPPATTETSSTKGDASVTTTSRTNTSTQTTLQRGGSASTKGSSTTSKGTSSAKNSGTSTNSSPVLFATPTLSIPSLGSANSPGSPSPSSSSSSLPSAVDPNPDSGASANTGSTIHPNLITGIIVSTFFAIVLSFLLLLYRRFRVNRARRAQEMPFAIEFIHLPKKFESRFSRFTLFSIIPRKIRVLIRRGRSLGRAPASRLWCPSRNRTRGRGSRARDACMQLRLIVGTVLYQYYPRKTRLEIELVWNCFAILDRIFCTFLIGCCAADACTTESEYMPGNHLVEIYGDLLE